MKKRFLIPTCAMVALLTPTAGEARQNNPLSCSFINKAYNNQGDCLFMDSSHSSVVITPNKKISSTTAAQWIVTTSIALQQGGENQFDTITVFTSPDGSGEYAAAKSSGKATILQEPTVIKSLTKICKTPNDWSDVVGPNGKPATPHKCRPLK